MSKGFDFSHLKEQNIQSFQDEDAAIAGESISVYLVALTFANFF